MRAKTKLIHGIRIGEPSTGSVNVPDLSNEYVQTRSSW